MAYGGILTDIASHQIDQFLHFTGSQDAEITHAAVENFAHPGDPGLQDFGEIALRSESGGAISGSTGSRPMRCPTGATGG
jgi:predicted dehydrogenase